MFIYEDYNPTILDYSSGRQPKLKISDENDFFVKAMDIYTSVDSRILIGKYCYISLQVNLMIIFEFRDYIQKRKKDTIKI